MNCQRGAGHGSLRNVEIPEMLAPKTGWARRRLSWLIVLGAGLCKAVATVPADAFAASGKVPRPCAVLTKAQAQSALPGKPVISVKSQSTECIFGTASVASGAGSFVSVQVFPSYVAGFRRDFLTAQRRSEGYKPVQGIGTLAAVRAVQSEIDVLKGTTQITVQVDILDANGISQPVGIPTLMLLARDAGGKV
jgi:hypothetical protein